MYGPPEASVTPALISVQVVSVPYGSVEMETVTGTWPEGHCAIAVLPPRMAKAEMSRNFFMFGDLSFSDR